MSRFQDLKLSRMPFLDPSITDFRASGLCAQSLVSRFQDVKIPRFQDFKMSRFQDVKISRCQYFELQVSVCNPVCVGVELDSCLYHQDFKIPVFQELNIWDLERGAELVSLPSRQVVWRPRDMTSVTYPYG